MAVLVQKFKARAAALPTFDVPFLIILLALLSYGLVMLFSAGYAVALYRRGDAYTYIRPQLLFAALGVAAMYAASLVDYHIWHKLAWPMLGLSLVLLTVVLFMPEYNGCKRWIVLPGLGTLQPSEIAKFSVVLVFSHIISLNHDRMKTFSTGVLPFALILGTVTVLMLLEPHLSGTLLILSIGAVLMFVGGTGLQWFGLAGGLGVAAIAAAVAALPELVPYATDRLASWRDPFADPLGEGHQTIQSLYAIASGGLAGLGLGNSRQKYLYVPEPQNDFIFSILCEELGFFGAALAVALFLLLLLRGMSIAGLLPADKVEWVEKLLGQKPAKKELAFVGDGINDAPVLMRADIGIAMGALGSDAAIEAADVVLMDDDPAKISLAMRISRKCMTIAYQNIVFALAIKALCLILTALGITNMWWGVFADVGVMVLAVLNATRMLNVKQYQ